MDRTKNLLISQQHPEFDWQDAFILTIEASQLKYVMLPWDDAVAAMRGEVEEQYRERIEWARENTPGAEFEYLPLKNVIEGVPPGPLADFYNRMKQNEAKIMGFVQGLQTMPFMMAVIVRIPNPLEAVAFKTRWG